MDGFGGAITDSSAVVLYRLSPPARAPAMRMLFDPQTGDGLSYPRQPIGCSASSTETIQGEYGAIQFVVYSQNPTGKPTAGPVGGWNQVTNKPVPAPTFRTNR